jgi:hypothetical protein
MHKFNWNLRKLKEKPCVKLSYQLCSLSHSSVSSIQISAPVIWNIATRVLVSDVNVEGRQQTASLHYS